MKASSKLERDADFLRLGSLLRDQASLGVLILDSRLNIRSLTPGAGQILRLPAIKAINGSVDALPEQLAQFVRNVLQSGETGTDHEITLEAGYGTETRLRVTAAFLQDGNPNSGLAVVFTEIGTQDRIEQKIRRLDRLASIGTLSASTAHEIKNALVAVKTFVDLLLEKNQDAELADVVRREMDRIGAMLSHTLKYAGPQRSSLSKVKLHGILEHSLRMVQPQFEKKLITLKRAFNASPDTLRGDDYRLEQVFVNLFLNALEAMGATGSLTLATDLLAPSAGDVPANADVSAWLRVTVADTGIGIAPENMSRLFQPFFTTKENGTGLGLAITQRIVEEHHGAINVRSETNKGTTFTVFFPLHEDAG